MLPALIGAGASIIGGLLNKSSSDKANQINQQNALRQEALQREFAQSGIQWKVEDARKAGVHPLYALGANTVSYTPQSVGAVADTSLGSAVASSGQDISRALQATRTGDDRASAFVKTSQDLALTKAGLENELLATQIAKMRGQIGPAMPSLADTNTIAGQPATAVNLGNPKDGPRNYQTGAGVVSANPLHSPQDAISREYGDEGLPQIPGQLRFAYDVLKALGSHVWRNWQDPSIMGSPANIMSGARRAERGALSDSQRRYNWSHRGVR